MSFVVRAGVEIGARSTFYSSRVVKKVRTYLVLNAPCFEKSEGFNQGFNGFPLHFGIEITDKGIDTFF